ncbi:MAG: substrate-binding domain-containing protein [Verrucomicrobia bacterium]|nr:substrate-binding domain-containing protein [Verrucomicrobiota bacterium]
MRATNIPEKIRLLVTPLIVLVTCAAFAQQRQPITNMTSEELLKFYQTLPLTNILPLPEGPVEVGGKVKQLTIGFSQTGFNHPWRVAMLQSLQAEAARHPNIQLIVTDGHVDIAKQSDDVRDLLARGVDAVIMSPVESAGLVPAARAVMQTKLPLVVLDRDVPTEKTLFIGQSNVTMAEQVAKRAAEELHGQGNVVVITGLKGSSPAVDRNKGMENVFKNYPNIKVLARGDGQWLREPAVKLMEDWLTAFPKIDAIFAHAEESSWGAELAIARANRCKDGIKHYTFDGSNAGFQSVKAGTFRADGNYTPFIGDIGLRAVIYTLTGKQIPGTERYENPGYELKLPDSPVVVPENADQWIGKGWGDFAPPPDPCR